MTKKKDKPLTLTEKYDLAMQYIEFTNSSTDVFKFADWLSYRKFNADQIKQFERVPF